MDYPSLLLENAVNELSKLPGIGKRTALRYALYLLKHEEIVTKQLAESIVKLRHNIKFCEICNSISDNNTCFICEDMKRNHSLVCVVENIRDVMAIENTHQYNGVYHVLGGIISPIDGISAKDIDIEHLISRVRDGKISELILALPTTIEGDTTSFYINKIITKECSELLNKEIKISTIARGIAIGDNIEFADEITLGRSIINRLPFDEIYQ
ncbi:MAG: recombination mediator RecR [Bacteroidales bacterium]|jgi:recombination protein RecR|nr:recombination mediator RecR [Bacteroidales bacterium]